MLAIRGPEGKGLVCPSYSALDTGRDRHSRLRRRIGADSRPCRLVFLVEYWSIITWVAVDVACISSVHTAEYMLLPVLVSPWHADSLRNDCEMRKHCCCDGA